MVPDGGFDKLAACFTDSLSVGEVLGLGEELEAAACSQIFNGCAVTVKTGVKMDLIPHKHLIPSRKILQHPIVKMPNMGSSTRERRPIQNHKFLLPLPRKKLIVVKLPRDQGQIHGFFESSVQSFAKTGLWKPYFEHLAEQLSSFLGGQTLSVR